MKGTDTFFSQVRVLLFSMGGDIIGDLLLYLPLWTGLVLFEKNASDIYAAADSYGVFIGRYLDMMLLVVVLLCMGILPGVAKAGAHIRKKEERYVQNAIQSGIQGVFLHGMFFTVWLAVLAVPLAQTIDNSVGILLGEMFTTGSSVVLWALLLFYCSQILKIIGKKPFAPVGIRCDGSRICHNVDYSFQNGKCRDSEHRPRECHRNGCRRCVSVCYIMSAEEDPARRTQRTGNSGRLLLCLRSAGIRSGKTVVPPCGSSGNGDFGTDHYVVTVLVPSAIVALSAGTGFSIYSRRQADAYAGENVPAVKFASDVYYSKNN